jgi:hypothetical protein
MKCCKSQSKTAKETEEGGSEDNSSRILTHESKEASNRGMIQYMVERKMGVNVC